VRALITGGRGFVGRWLARHLEEEGDEVLLVDKETDVADPSAFGPVLADFGPDPRALVVSSSEVYGAVAPERLPVDETAPVAPLSPYAASKAAAEQVALQAARGYRQEVVVARPFNHIGPGQPPQFAVPALAQRIVAASREGRRELPVGTLSARRDFTDVRDVVRAYRLLVLHGEPGGVYNICSGHDVAVKEVLDELLSLSGARLRPVTDPHLVRPTEIPVMQGSAAKLAALTGWKPEIPLADTLADVLGYFEAQAEKA
jgi:GDP-4-dehydro-6-deoxy-D-mannose reductase